MKLKALKPRLYNSMFHVHTVSGIVLSFALFIIFYAGAIALFRDELYRWENPKARFETQEDIDVNFIFNSLKKFEKDTINFESFMIIPPSEENPFIKFYTKKTLSKNKSSNVSYFINPHNGAVFLDPHSYDNPKSLTYMADTIYTLHYFRQIPGVGVYLAGLIGVFLVLILSTGVLIHWKNIISKFYNFSVQGAWKQIWTNSHTVLGLITLPFQFIYAITGALIGISILLLAPSAFILFGGDTDEVVKFVNPNAVIKYEESAKRVTEKDRLIELYTTVRTKYPKHKITRIKVNHYGKEDGTILFKIDDEIGIAGDGELLFKYKDGSLIDAVIPDHKSYTRGTYGLFRKLHYANYGGFLLKIIYFILAMITCYVITSGVMIWQKARDTSKYTAKQKRFHHKVTMVYLAFTLSLFPAIAIIFMANKSIPMYIEERVVYVKTIFFVGWLVLTVIGSLFWKNYAKLHSSYLIIGSLMGLCIPILNGVVTQDWIWKTFMNGQYYVFSVDVTWLLTGVFGLVMCRHLKKKA